MKRQPLTESERQRRHRATGKPLAVTLTDPLAIAALRAAREATGGIKAGIEAALIAWHRSNP